MAYIDYDHIYKIIVVGDASVGKTSIIHLYVKKEFIKHDSTIGAAFNSVQKIKYDEINPVNVRLSIWDTAGQERFRSIVPIYIKNAQIILMVFDLTNPDTFKDLSEIWLQLLEMYHSDTKEPQIMYIIGNKLDLIDDTLIIDNKIADLLSKIRYLYQNIFYYKVSAKDIDSIDDLFENIYDDSMKYLYKYQDTLENNEIVVLNVKSNIPNCCSN